MTKLASPSCPYCASRFVTRSIKVLRVEGNTIALALNGLLNGTVSATETSNIESIYNVKCGTCSRKYQCIYGSAATGMFNDIKNRTDQNPDRRQTIIDRLKEYKIEPKDIPKLITAITVPQNNWLSKLNGYAELHIFMKNFNKMYYLVLTYQLSSGTTGTRYSLDDVCMC